jgi:PHD/YefM family antitoxin component YafN of YafNO toxin-antitoxin module
MYIMYMSIEMPVSQARAELGPVTSRAEYHGETTYLLKHGHRAAAVVPAAVAELMEQIEDILDGQAVAEVLVKLAAGTEDVVPFVRRTHRHDT